MRRAASTNTWMSTLKKRNGTSAKPSWPTLSSNWNRGSNQVWGILTGGFCWLRMGRTSPTATATKSMCPASSRNTNSTLRRINWTAWPNTSWRTRKRTLKSRACSKCWTTQRFRFSRASTRNVVITNTYSRCRVSPCSHSAILLRIRLHWLLGMRNSSKVSTAQIISSLMSRRSFSQIRLVAKSWSNV